MWLHLRPASGCGATADIPAGLQPDACMVTKLLRDHEAVVLAANVRGDSMSDVLDFAAARARARHEETVREMIDVLPMGAEDQALARIIAYDPYDDG
jgi:hypothetical protein